MIEPIPSVQTQKRPDPDISHLVIERKKPVDNLFSDKQERLLTESLSSSWDGGGRSFVAFANVGLFYTIGGEHLVPDVMVSMDLKTSLDLTDKRTMTYLLWDRGKPPEIVIEIVSNKKGREEEKLATYARIGVSYAVILDPLHKLGPRYLRVWRLHEGKYIRMRTTGFMPEIGLSLCLWDGVYEGASETWLRWRDAKGLLIPTGRERAEVEQRRAEDERRRAEDERRRADAERRRADDERRRADATDLELRRLEAERNAALAELNALRAQLDARRLQND